MHDHLTHAMSIGYLDVHFVDSAPASPLSAAADSEYAANGTSRATVTARPHSLGR